LLIVVLFRDIVKVEVEDPLGHQVAAAVDPEEGVQLGHPTAVVVYLASLACRV